MVDYAAFVGRALHVGKSTMATEHDQSAALPTDWADMHGWPELAAAVARVYWTLPPRDARECGDRRQQLRRSRRDRLLRPRSGLPPAISGHNNYWLWGTHGASGDVVIDVNGDCGASAALYRDARLAARFNSPWVISYERDIPIMVCTGPTQNLTKIWPSLKHYI